MYYSCTLSLAVYLNCIEASCPLACHCCCCPASVPLHVLSAPPPPQHPPAGSDWGFIMFCSSLHYFYVNLSAGSDEVRVRVRRQTQTMFCCCNKHYKPLRTWVVWLKCWLNLWNLKAPIFFLTQTVHSRICPVPSDLPCPPSSAQLLGWGHTPMHVRSRSNFLGPPCHRQRSNTSL